MLYVCKTLQLTNYRVTLNYWHQTIIVRILLTQIVITFGLNNRNIRISILTPHLNIPSWLYCMELLYSSSARQLPLRNDLTRLRIRYSQHNSNTVRMKDDDYGLLL